jgi:CheY-like chemotaxis protein
LNSADIEPAKKPLVLVVEDDALTQMYLTKVLAQGFEPLLATSGEEVRAQLDAHPDVEVVLMDLSLKGDEDGLQITRWMRADARWKNVPIIATTAHVMPEDRRAALAAGCTAYLAKPISPPVLIAAVLQALDGAGRDDVVTITALPAS